MPLDDAFISSSRCRGAPGNGSRGASRQGAIGFSLLLAAGASQAGFSHSNVTSPGGFVSACNGINQRENPDPGNDLSNGLNRFNLYENAISGASSSPASSSYVNGTHQNNGPDTAVVGYMRASVSAVPVPGKIVMMLSGLATLFVRMMPEYAHWYNGHYRPATRHRGCYPMNHPFPVHTEESAPESARPLLQQAAENLGSIPNLERVMASAPALLAGYVQLWELFDQTSLSPVERQVVYQTANFENECNYCVPWHTELSRLAKMASEDVQALREGRALSDPRLEALRCFTQSLIRTRGKVARAELEAFFAHGWKPQQALEIILGLAVKTMSNYTNSVAGTPLDETVQKHAWEKPTISPRS